MSGDPGPPAWGGTGQHLPRQGGDTGCGVSDSPAGHWGECPQPSPGTRHGGKCDSCRGRGDRGLEGCLVGGPLLLERGQYQWAAPAQGGWQGREEEVRASPSHDQALPPARLPASEGQRETASLPKCKGSATGSPPFGSCPPGLCHPSDGAEVPGAAGRRPYVPQPPCPSPQSLPRRLPGRRELHG